MGILISVKNQNASEADIFVYYVVRHASASSISKAITSRNWNKT